MNLSKTGILVRCKRVFPKGTAIQLYLKEFKAKGEVVWTQESEDSGRLLGMRFVSLRWHDKRFIRSLAALQLFSDYVRAELTEPKSPLPRIPSLSIGFGGLYDGGRLHADVSARRTARQSRVARLEGETPGYTMVDGSVTYRLLSGQSIHEVTLSGTNLTDEEARSHISLLKDSAPFPGREIQLIYRLSF